MTTPPEPTLSPPWHSWEPNISSTEIERLANRVLTAEADNQQLRDRLALAEAKLAESERVSAERLARLSELRDTLARIETASRKLGVAPGQLGDMAGRILGGPTRP